MARNDDYRCSWVLDCANPATRVWGVLSAIVMWGIGGDVAFHEHNLGIYVLIAAVILTFLETMFVVNIFLELCLKDEKHPCLQCWQVIQWLDYWKKSVLYLAMAVLCFLQPRKVWLATVAGVMLIVLAILYLILTYKSRLMARDALLSDKECSYDRFDELQEEIDDSLPEPSTDSVGDQDQILRV